jgi:putative DNA primase/helicase
LTTQKSWRTCEGSWRDGPRNAEILKVVEPHQPPGLNDRAADNWRPMLAIAHVAGGGWPDLAATAAMALSGSREDDDNLVRLLADIRDTFPRTPLPDPDQDCFSPTALAAALAKIEDAPWSEWRRGKPITPNGLTRLLKRCHIKPDRSRGGGRYFRRQFEDAWRRMLPVGG